MKRGWIVFLGVLLIALGVIIWEFLPAIYFLVMFAMEPAGQGCDEGPVTTSAPPMRGVMLSRNILGPMYRFWNGCRLLHRVAA